MASGYTLENLDNTSPTSRMFCNTSTHAFTRYTTRAQYPVVLFYEDGGSIPTRKRNTTKINKPIRRNRLEVDFDLLDKDE